MGKLAASRTIRIAIASVGIAVCTVAFTLPMRGQEVPLKQQLRGRHRLLRRVFVNAGDNDVKGLAATIKADEITVRHRIKAVRYLATVDSGSYPEAKQMLIDTLHNDKWEEVRFEAAKALRLMLAGNASGAEYAALRARSMMGISSMPTRPGYGQQPQTPQPANTQPATSPNAGSAPNYHAQMDRNKRIGR